LNCSRLNSDQHKLDDTLGTSDINRVARGIERGLEAFDFALEFLHFLCSPDRTVPLSVLAEVAEHQFPYLRYSIDSGDPEKQPVMRQSSEERRGMLF
jgi:hypothetical protein